VPASTTHCRTPKCHTYGRLNKCALGLCMAYACTTNFPCSRNMSLTANSYSGLRLLQLTACNYSHNTVTTGPYLGTYDLLTSTPACGPPPHPVRGCHWRLQMGPYTAAVIPTARTITPPFSINALYMSNDNCFRVSTHFVYGTTLRLPALTYLGRPQTNFINIVWIVWIVSRRSQGQWPPEMSPKSECILLHQLIVVHTSARVAS
jgi:hypothetical protein